MPRITPGTARSLARIATLPAPARRDALARLLENLTAAATSDIGDFTTREIRALERDIDAVDALWRDAHGVR